MPSRGIGMWRHSAFGSNSRCRSDAPPRSQDSNGFAIFLQQVADPVVPNGTALWFQVEDVDAAFAEMSARGIAFAHPPRKTYWGYGTELADPDGYRLRLWDERTMREK